MKQKTILTTTILLLTFFGYLTTAEQSNELLAYSKDFYSKIKLFTSMLETISRAYVEEREPDELLHDAIKGVLNNLDPHTVFLPAGDFRNWNQNFEGYNGIGISLDMIGGRATFMSVLESSPADRAGVEAGDKILEINGRSTLTMKKEDMVSELLGPVGLHVDMVVAGHDDRQRQALRITREKIQLNSVSNTQLLTGRIGYIKISKFSSTTTGELERALDRLERQGMRYLILDLRGNGGGYLHAAVDVADKFIPAGNIIVSTKGRLTSSFHDYYASRAATHNSYPVAVLVDHGSASAAEIVAGAIQDLDRGLIVGKSTFGKGLVQSQYRFHDGSALLITTARYYTPSGRPIQRDYYDKTKAEYYWDAYMQHPTGLEESEIQFQTSSGRPVIAGAGITPDIWVENDDDMLPDTIRALLFSELRPFYMYGERLLRANPKLKKLGSQFVSRFIVTDLMFQEFCQFVKGVETSAVDVDLTESEDQIRFLLKREIAYLVGGEQARFQVNLYKDRQLQTAMSHFEQAQKLMSASNVAPKL
jgi:carboxyl-terminal processing protease